MNLSLRYFLSLRTKTDGFRYSKTEERVNQDFDLQNRSGMRLNRVVVVIFENLRE